MHADWHRWRSWFGGEDDVEASDEDEVEEEDEVREVTCLEKVCCGRLMSEIGGHFLCKNDICDLLCL